MCLIYTNADYSRGKPGKWSLLSNRLQLKYSQTVCINQGKTKGLRGAEALFASRAVVMAAETHGVIPVGLGVNTYMCLCH